jgi:hypothetical protein
LLVIVLAVSAHAQTFVRFPGGGGRATDCMLVTEVVGPPPATRTARCTDGDSTCDADAAADGICHFSARVCIDQAVDARCHTDVVTAASVATPAPALVPLADALAALPMPLDAPGACTSMVDLAVPAGRPRAGRVVLRASATMASGHTDRDRVTFVCRAAPPPPTLARVQKRVFSRSCASSSCHGAAAAGGLGLLPGDAHSNLVDVPASNAVAAAAGLRRVVPGDPGASFLVRKLTGALAPGEGDPMPQVGGSLAPADVELVKRWIAADAPF